MSQFSSIQIIEEYKKTPFETRVLCVCLSDVIEDIDLMNNAKNPEEKLSADKLLEYIGQNLNIFTKNAYIRSTEIGCRFKSYHYNRKGSNKKLLKILYLNEIAYDILVSKFHITPKTSS